MKKWNVAVYLRLSSDDGDKSESNSIGNQRNIIKQYIKNLPEPQHGSQILRFGLVQSISVLSIIFSMIELGVII